jgi:hypothetical protein
MHQDYGKKPLAYRLSRASSALIMFSWLAYFAYLEWTDITIQSIHMGEITFFAALLLALSGVTSCIVIALVAYLAFIRDPLAKASIVWGCGALFVAGIVFGLTRSLISHAI